MAGLRQADSTASGPPDRFDARISVPQTGQPQLRLLRRIGRTDPESLDDYRANGGYDALRRALKIGRDRVVRELVDSRLRGRGGAAFPTGKKWDPANRPYFLVCNADESEPGTFKDRVIMEGDPFALVEAMTIAGFATGCEHAYLYVRGEYPLAFDRLVRAIEICRNRDFLGERILGHDFRFDIELRRGAGAYICGEETALFNSIEGFRGEPRNKPPFPTQYGLFGKPTVVNNVETLVNVLDIVLQGGENYASIGTAASAGTKLFCLSGHVSRPGVYEVPFGTTLRQLIDLGGGVAGTGRLQAILLGGAAGSFVSPEELDTPLTFEGTRDVGATLGSGVVMLFDDQVDLKGILLRVAAFFRDESCGQCVPCRVGTVRQEELVHRLAGGKPAGSVEEELVLLREIGQVMRDASICGLGKPHPVRSSRPLTGSRSSGKLNETKGALMGVEDKKDQVSSFEGPSLVPIPQGPVPAVAVPPRPRTVELTIDGQKVSVSETATLLETCRSLGIDIPTLCFLETLKPVNVCRICVVEVEGSRTLVPACSRKVEPGMKVKTDSDRVRLSRRLILEFLASSVDVSTAPALKLYMERYGAQPERFGPPAPTSPPTESRRGSSRSS